MFNSSGSVRLLFTYLFLLVFTFSLGSQTLNNQGSNFDFQYHKKIALLSEKPVTNNTDRLKRFSQDLSGLLNKLSKTQVNDYVLTEEISESWWGDYYKEKSVFSYDNARNNTHIEIFQNVNEEWQNYSRQTLSYDEASQQIEIFIEAWYNEVWNNNYKQVFTYEDGQLTEDVSYYWQAEDWAPSLKTVNSYDNNANIEEALSQEWIGTAWKDYSVTQYTYDENNFLSEEISQYWGEGWENSERSVYDTDDSGKILETIISYWNGDGWDDNYKAVISYNESGDQTGTIGYGWDEDAWVNTTRLTFTYENGNNILYTFEANYDGDGWETMVKISSTYEIFVTALEDISQKISGFVLNQNYPNPFNPSTVINYQLVEAGPVELSIYTIGGQKVATLVNTNQTAGSYSINWDANGYASGIYLYTLKSVNQVQTRKMLLVR